MARRRVASSIRAEYTCQVRRPAALAWYMAVSACLSSSVGTWAWSGNRLMPIEGETVIS